ncbi:MAG: DUF5711 family protein [Bacteroides sp.]
MADIREYKKLKEQKSNVVSGKSRFNVQPLPPSKEDEYFEDEAYDDGDEAEEESDDEYRTRLRRHRIRVVVFSVLGIILAAAAVIYIVFNIDNHSYASYTIMSSVTRDEVTNARYFEFGDGYVRCSNDGVVYFNKKGTAVWNQTYQMKSPQLVICKDCLAVGDINGSTIYVFNTKGMLGSIDTSLSISQIEVGSGGVVAAVLEDSTANYINMYEASGSKIYSVKTTLAGDGYPLDISISDDMTKLIASYVYVSGESIKTNVVFYNFSDVGQNETERVVGGFNHYENTIVPEVEFMNNTCAVAVGEDILSIYKIKEFPNLSKEIKFDSNIERVFTSDKYIGILMENKESGDNFKLVVYENSGNKVCETTFNTSYDTIKFDGDSILLYNDKIFTLMNMRGKTLANLEFDLPIENVLSLGARGSYLLVNSTYVQEIRLK